MKLKLMATLAFATVFGLLGQTADAATFNLTYKGDAGNILAMTIEGTLLADGNQVLVSGISNPTVDGNPMANPLTRLDALTYLQGRQPANEVLLSLNGRVMDFVAQSADSIEGVVFLVIPDVQSLTFAGYNSGNWVPQAFDTARYSLTEVSAVPLHAGGLLLLSGLGLLALRRKR